MKIKRIIIVCIISCLFVGNIVGIVLYNKFSLPPGPEVLTPSEDVFDMELWHQSLGGYDLDRSYDPIYGELVNQETQLFINEAGEKSIWAPNVKSGEIFRIINVGTIDLIYQFNIKALNFMPSSVARPVADALSLNVLQIESIVGRRPNMVMNGINYQGGLSGDGYTILKELKASEFVDFSMVVGWISSSEDAEFAVDNGLSVSILINVVALPLRGEADFSNTGNQEYVDSVSNGGGIIIDKNVTDVCIDIKEDSIVELDIQGKEIFGRIDTEVIVNNGILILSGNGKLESQSPILMNNGYAALTGINAVCKDKYYGLITKGEDSITIIDDIVFYGERGALSVTDGKLIFNSGSVTVDGYGGNVGHVVYAEGTAEITINGGTFKHNRNCTKGAMIYAAGDSVVIVNGGSFTKGPNDYIGQWIKTVDNGQVIVKGGTFQFDPSDFVAEGYMAQKNSKGWYDVVKIA